MHKASSVFLIAASGALVMSSGALGAEAVGLVGDKTLVMFDTEGLAATGTVEVGGVDRLIGIDVRPGDGMLYGVTSDGRIVTIDLASGAATDKSKLSQTLGEGVEGSVDFNPVADRLRIVGTDGSNLRVNVEDGAVTADGNLAYADADMHAGETPAIVAVAYTNSNGKPEATAMYDVDATIGALIRQNPPNDGILAAVGKFGIDTAETYALDIAATADLTNTAYLVADGTLHTLDLESGAATAVGAITGLEDGTIRDIAILP